MKMVLKANHDKDKRAGQKNGWAKRGKSQKAKRRKNGENREEK